MSDHQCIQEVGSWQQENMGMFSRGHNRCRSDKPQLGLCQAKVTRVQTSRSKEIMWYLYHTLEHNAVSAVTWI